jgi:glycosyltransferase involved in cell wall biosynthesis
VAAGTTGSAEHDHRAIHRSAAIEPLVERPDLPDWRLVHAHVGYPEGVAAAVAAQRLSLPLVVTEHATFVESFLADPGIRARYVETMLGAARVIAVSRMLATELEGAIPALAGRVVVIPNTVAVDDFQPAPRSERVPDELLWVGYRKEIKGIESLLRAFRIVRETRPAATLRLIGRSATSADETGWLRLAAELGIADAVRFEPPADRAGVVAAMRRASCFVHASTRETFGVVAVEALASGLPIVATDSGGVTEVLGDTPDSLGTLVPTSDPAAFAAAVIRTLERLETFDPDTLHRYAKARFGSIAVAGQIATLYDEVLEEVDQAGGSTRGPATTPVVAPSSPAAPGSGRIILAAFLRTELDRALERFPAWVLRDVEIATSGPALPGRSEAVRAPAGSDERLATLVEWGAPKTGTTGRFLRRIRRGSQLLARIAGNQRAAGGLIAELTRTLAFAIERGSDGAPPLLVCLSGIDYLVAAPLIAAGDALPAPGGLRWLADRQADRRTADRAISGGGSPA